VRYSQLVEPVRSAVVEAAASEPGPGEVLIGVEACGVCASELHTWMSGPASSPRRLGHEPAGVVRALGPGARRFRVGDRVTGLSSGAYSDTAIAREEFLLPIPDGVATEAALGEPLACLVNGARRTRVELGDRVALIGLGFMGLGMLQLLKLRGAGYILAVDVREDARRRALALGADEAVHPDEVADDFLLTEWKDWEGPCGVDVVVEATGTQAGLTLAGRMVRAHGVLSILGFHQGVAREVDVEMWNWKAIDVVNAHVRRRADLMESMRMGLDLTAHGRLDLGALVTHRYTLEDVDRAYADLRDKPEGFTKAVVYPGR